MDNMLKLLTPQNIIPKKINPQNIGWIRPDKTIAFSSTGAAARYAKNRAIDALHQKTPFERAVIYKKNVVLAEYGGDEKHVNITISDSITKDATLAHGHPYVGKNVTNPITLGDFQSLLIGKFHKIIAYNNKGEYSYIVQTKGAKKLDILELGEEITDKYYQKLSERFFPEEFQKAGEAFYNAFDSTNKQFKNPQKAKEGLDLYLKKPHIAGILNNILETYQRKGNAIQKFVQNFWLKNLPQDGYKYVSNMSHLN